MAFVIFGHRYWRARKDYTCWLCGGTIAKGSGYLRTAGTVKGRMFSVKHCREKCECTAEVLEQNPHLAQAVFHPTLSVWECVK